MNDTPNSSVVPATESRHRRWDPFAMFAELESEMDRVFGHRLPSMLSPRRYTSALGKGWAPSSDVYEKAGTLVIKAELPGVARDDIDVTVEHGDLVIKGERTSESEIKEEDYYRMERFSGSFYRRYPLPEGIDEDRISAEYRDGVLEVHIPKPSGDSDQPPTRKITVT